MTDVDSNGQSYVKFWIDDFHGSPAEEQAARHVAEERATEREPQQLPMAIPAFPVFSERSAESRAPRTPERREGLTLDIPLRKSIGVYCLTHRAAENARLLSKQTAF